MNEYQHKKYVTRDGKYDAVILGADYKFKNGNDNILAILTCKSTGTHLALTYSDTGFGIRYVGATASNNFDLIEVEDTSGKLYEWYVQSTEDVWHKSLYYYTEAKAWEVYKSAKRIVRGFEFIPPPEDAQ